MVLLVGGHTSDGWVTELDGRDTIFLALEYLGDPPYDGVLVSHEAFHVAHARHGAGGWPEDGAASLFQEGLAVAVSRAAPPRPARERLPVERRHPRGVGRGVRARPRARRADARGLDTSYDDEAVRALFTGGQRQPGLPVRAGYWLGDVVMRSLLEEIPSDELIEWDHPTARLAVADRLGEMI